jgi:hypothetical protein
MLAAEISQIENVDSIAHGVKEANHKLNYEAHIFASKGIYKYRTICTIILITPEKVVLLSKNNHVVLY